MFKVYDFQQNAVVAVDVTFVAVFTALAIVIVFVVEANIVIVVINVAIS